MWGAIIGDIVGSPYEFSVPFKSKDFRLFDPAKRFPRAQFTDDSVCTAAVADILLNGRPPVAAFRDWCGQRYPGKSYGVMFRGWLDAGDPQPYNSFGNGAAMRVSPAALVHRADLAAALAASDLVTEVTHNHPEGMKGARATVHTIWLALRDDDPDAIRGTIEAAYGYDLSAGVDEIRPSYEYNETCQRTVPEAITCALESTSFEDAVRSAVSLGGDADTLAAIAGPVAEAMHGIPDWMREEAEMRFLRGARDLVETVDAVY